MGRKSDKGKETATFPDTASRAKAIAEVTTSPVANAAAVIEKYGVPFGEQSIGALCDSLRSTTKQVHDGDMKHVEAMLINQAEALSSIFMNFSRRALAQEYQKQFESFFRMALKAQNQCRMTLETLATIKNPPIVYAKQANITSGLQQVNNGTMPTDHAHAGKIQNQPNELLEQKAHEQLDTRAQGATSRADPAMATVGEIHRSQKRTRKG